MARTVENDLIAILTQLLQWRELQEMGETPAHDHTERVWASARAARDELLALGDKYVDKPIATEPTDHRADDLDSGAPTATPRHGTLANSSVQSPEPDSKRWFRPS